MRTLAIAFLALALQDEERKLLLTVDAKSDVGEVDLLADGSHWTFWVMKGMTEVFYVDGKEVSGKYDVAGDRTASADGLHYGFTACKGDDYVVVIDGKEHGPFKSASLITMSDSGGHYAFKAGREGKYEVFVDGKAVGEFEDASHLRFSADGAHFAFVGRREKASLVVIDGKEVGRYEWVLELLLSADGQHYALVSAGPSKPRTCVLDGKSVGEYESVAGLALSRDGKRHGFVGKVRGRWQVMVDGKKTAENTAYDIRHFAFSPDFEHYVYVVVGGPDDSMVVKDGKEIGKFSVVTPPVFSPDGKHYAFRARNKSGTAVVVDGQGTFGRDYPSEPVFLPDGRVRYTIFEPGKKLFLITRKP